MSNAPSRHHFFLRRPPRTSIEGGAVAAGVALVLPEEERAFELPGRLFEVLPLAVYVCDRDRSRSSVQSSRR